ncbi:hypothetical protein NQ317_012144 [Molorchus minor]|uniref:Uncharacterized protein n=1 Tax=Molorchus minor TaxID=1323400 RepID=A0ABQ9K197_9CUCU|nr:hypothetical protein NQ317_012144 [Molorchus minor]
MKVVIRVLGAGRCDKLVNLKNIEDNGSVLVSHSFVVSGDEGKDFNGLETYRKFAALRFSHLGEGRLFLLSFVEMYSATNRLVADYLKLKDDNYLYIEHCFRRTSAIFLANASADILTLKRHGESYVEESVANKIKIARKNGEEGTSNKIRVQVEAAQGLAGVTETDQASGDSILDN